MEVYEEIRADRELGAKRLVAEYRTRLTSAAMLLCNNAHEAEDLVFRAFEKAILNIDAFRPTGSFYYWIYTILLNFHRMDVRKRLSRPETLVEEIPEDREDEEHNPFDAFLMRGTAEAVRSAVSQLPEQFREVVILRYFEEMSTAEVAKVAGIPEGTVRSRLHYAKNALREMLEGTELSPDFTDRLVRATRPKGGFFRRSWVASLAILLGLFAIAAGTAVAVTATASAPVSASGSKSADGEGAEALAEARRAAPAWRVLGEGSTFSDVSDKIDIAVENGLKYIQRQQKASGAFQGTWGDTAALPALAGMAILSKGHLPGTEPYAEMFERCLKRVLACADMGEKANFRGYMGAPGGGNMYAHCIATLFLSEASGMVGAKWQKKIDEILPNAIKVILDAQNQKKGNADHIGGWRYQPNSGDSDLSCSGWALMALRSARLNGAALPPDAIEKAVLYVKRAQNASSGGFCYQGNGSPVVTLSGAGILCLELCGKHLDPASLKAALYLDQCARQQLQGGYQHYGLYYVAQGLFQLGGEPWRRFSAWMYDDWAKRQKPDGSWQGGSEPSPVYCTAMTILAFTVPYRMLPIYQRDETVDADEEGKDTRK